MGKFVNRWELAQEYERSWWEKRKEEVDFNFYKNYATDLKKELKDYLQIDKQTKILEVGSGAGGIITFIQESAHRFGIDPLEGFYSTIPEFKAQRDSSIYYSTGKGEMLPYPDNEFDLIIMDNVLDHCEDPKKVIKEARRVLRKGEIVYFKQNTYHLWGKIVRWLMEFLLIDKGHPHTFSKKDIQELFQNNNFIILKSKSSGYLKTWLREITSKKLKDKIKALLFVTRDKATYILKK